jgi:paraquat-inducible protein B
MDARELLTAALHPFATPRKDGATLDSAAIGKELDAGNKNGWTSKFLAALDRVPLDALADRAAARAYFNGNDRETFSMLHKLAELGDFDNVQRKTVTKEDIKRLLADAKIRQNVEQLLADQLPNVFGQPNAFGGAGSMGEIMSAAVGSYLLARLTKNHKEIEGKIDRELDQSQAAIAELARQLGLEQKQVERLRSETRDLQSEIAGLKRSIKGKDDEIDTLERELARERRTHETRRTYATSYPSGSTGC